MGGEFERTVVRPDGQPVAYDDPDGIRWILEQLAARGGWQPVFEGPHLIALERDGASITLEPGGQVELSGRPHRTLSGLAEEMRANRRALLEVAEGHDLVWIACGLTPIADIDDISWTPKGRYRIMREYLPQKGSRAHWMMKGTNAVQCNLDYADEADCAAKVRLAASLAPLTTAIFSNSPLYRNQPTGFMSTRGYIWTQTDPARCGFPPQLRGHYTHAGWVDWLLDVPMMFLHPDDRWLPAHGRTFREWMEHGIDGRYPTMADWNLHQTAVFPEVRIKHTIEVRGADCVDHELALAFVSLFTGLFYCPRALDEGLALAAELERHGTHAERFDIACRDGLHGIIGGRRIADWASDLGDLAERGLKRCMPDDIPLLEPLLERLEEGLSPADDLLAAWERDPSPEAVVRAVAY